MVNKVADLRSLIRDVPDFPKPGIVFKDITPLLGDPQAFASAIENLVEPYREKGIQKVVGIESRGFLFASAAALQLQAGVVLIRKKGKLPYRKLQTTYDLEYGQDTLEIHEDALQKGERALILDDVLATGGTAKAACDLVERLGAEITGVSFLIELKFLNGRSKLPGRPITSLIEYS